MHNKTATLFLNRDDFTIKNANVKVELDFF